MPPSLFTTALQDVTAADLEAVIGWPESGTLEFKERMPSRDGRADGWSTGHKLEIEARDKVFKEIVALANSGGGHVLIGVGESDERPPVASGLLPVPACVDLAERLSQAASQAIDPPIPLLLIRGIPIEPNGGGIVMCRVPASRSRPHRAPDLRCYVRRDTESLEMGMREIRDMTLAAVSGVERIDRAMEQRSEALLRFLTVEEPTACRITAVPVGTEIDLGRVFRRRGLVLSGRYRTYLGRAEEELVGGCSPGSERPIVRGTRFSGSSSVIDVMSDGCIDFMFRKSPRGGNELVMHLAWILGDLVNVLRTVVAVRRAALAPDVEFAIETEIAVLRSHPFNLYGFDPFNPLIASIPAPLRLPRVSFGTDAEIDRVVSIVFNDLCDAAGLPHAELVSVRVELP